MAPKVLLTQASLVLILSLATAEQLQSPAAAHSLLLKRQADEPLLGCETDRSSDYYGLGVRIGIYFTWLSAWISNSFLPNEVAGGLDANAIWLFAILLAMVRCTISGALEQMDGLMLMHASAGTILGVLSIWGYRTCRYNEEGPKAIKYFGGFGTHLRILLCASISGYGVWYWMFGIMGSLSISNPDCQQVYTFMFAKIDARGPIRTFYIFVCIVSLIYFCIMLLVSSIAGFTRLNKVIGLARLGQWREDSRLKFATGLNMRELRICYKICRIITFLWMLFSAFALEFTLNFNNVAGVLGRNGKIFFPSQLLPLLIGAGSFVRIAFLWFEDWRGGEKTTPSLESDSQTTPSSPVEIKTLPTGVRMLKLFSQPTAAVHNKPIHHDEEVDPLVEGRSAVVRYLVTWLPWLSLIRWYWAKKGPDDNSQHHGSDTLPTTNPSSSHTHIQNQQQQQMQQSKKNDLPPQLAPIKMIEPIDTATRNDSWESDDTMAGESEKRRGANPHRS